MWVGSCSQLFAWGFGSFSCHPDTSTRFMGNLEMARALSLSLYLHTSESNLCTNPIASIGRVAPPPPPPVHFRCASVHVSLASPWPAPLARGPHPSTFLDTSMPL